MDPTNSRPMVRTVGFEVSGGVEEELEPSSLDQFDMEMLHAAKEDSQFNTGTPEPVMTPFMADIMSATGSPQRVGQRTGEDGALAKVAKGTDSPQRSSFPGSASTTDSYLEPNSLDSRQVRREPGVPHCDER
eukprot:scaffold1511_cov347-Prasinococcus_capsulatus_cf.AAC.7